MTEATLKAYIVTDVTNEQCDVLAAPSPAWAKAHSDVDADYCDKRAKRLPDCDNLINDGKITAADAFMAEAIMHECHECYAMTGRSEDGTVVDGHILCADCAASALEGKETNHG